MKKAILILSCFLGFSTFFSFAQQNPPSILYFYIYSTNGQEYFGKNWPKATDLNTAIAMDQAAKNDNSGNMCLFEGSKDLRLRILLNKTVPADTTIYLKMRFTDYSPDGGVDTRAAVNLPDSIPIPSGVTLFEYPFQINHLPEAQNGGLARIEGYVTYPNGAEYSRFSDRANFYNRFVYDVQFYETAPLKGNVRINIKGSSKHVVCSFDGGLTWQSALEKEFQNVDIPEGVIYIKEPNSPHLSEIHVNDFISDGWGTFSTNHAVNIPSVNNVSINPYPGTHYVQSNKDFMFILTPTGENENKIPDVTINRTGTPDSKGIEITDNRDGSFNVSVLNVQETINLSISWNEATGNDSFYSTNSARIWTDNETLFITSPTAGNIFVYNATGGLVDIFKVSEKEIISAVLPKGLYLVKLNNNTYKALIK